MVLSGGVVLLQDLNRAVEKHTYFYQNNSISSLPKNLVFLHQDFTDKLIYYSAKMAICFSLLCINSILT